MFGTAMCRWMNWLCEVIKMLFNKCVLVLNLEKVNGDRSGKNALFDNVRSRALFPAVVTS